MSTSSVTRRQWGAHAALATAAVCMAAPAFVQAQSLAGNAARVRIAVGGCKTLYYLPLVIADLLGFFTSEGLDVSLHDQAGGALALQALRAGDADVCCAAYEHTLRAAVAPGITTAQGALRSLAVLGRAPQLALGASTRTWPLRSVARFKGMRVGVSAPGSSTQFLASLWLAQAGAALDEVSFVGVGSGIGALSALRQGTVHALCHADPLMTLLEQRGDVRLLADTRTLKASADLFAGPMPAACLLVPGTFAEQRPAQAQALTNALVHALKWLQTASPADLARAVPADHMMGDRSAYLAAFQRTRETLSPDGLMPDDGPATALRALARLRPELDAGRVDLARTFTNAYVRKAKLKFNL
ncbi:MULTISPECIES: ABC transporter substrate-binding protein [unclassified Acidovorax]|uniref:ABC transporter substrate-binding protein n=1 Tax=unclassified Acidovorax TaxID=2684926 RepID=UPI00288346D7|nr:MULTISPECIES: ABC transporter substrate-binding protein [unclassified Acidovorax]